jgi:hypothetical protein
VGMTSSLPNMSREQVILPLYARITWHPPASQAAILSVLRAHSVNGAMVYNGSVPPCEPVMDNEAHNVTEHCDGDECCEHCEPPAICLLSVHSQIHVKF